MTLLAEVVDAVIGGDTHRDTHALEMLAPNGATITTLTIDNDDVGFVDAIAWIAEHAPGPRIVVGLEGTRSYGIGLARAVRAAGLVVVEVERPRRADRRRGKSDPIDAHLAALQVLRMTADRLPMPRVDGDREALRILLGARREMTVTKTKQINRLRALLLSGDDTDRNLSRGALTDTKLQAIARRRGRAGNTAKQAVRRAEARRLAIAIRNAIDELADNKRQLASLVSTIASVLLDRPDVGTRQRGAGDRVGYSNMRTYASGPGSRNVSAMSARGPRRASDVLTAIRSTAWTRSTGSLLGQRKLRPSARANVPA